MKIKDLTKQLQGLNPELDIYIACDIEGNTFYNKATIELTDVGNNDLKFVLFPDEIIDL